MLVALSGCMQRELKPLNPCLISGVVETVEVNGVDKVDLLFVVDSSRSMLDEQVKLKEQIPNLVRILASGKREDGTTFPAAKDMHLGVVTTDMGVPGANLREDYHCSRNRGYGDDGVLQSRPGPDYVDAMDAAKNWSPSAECMGFVASPSFVTFDQKAGDNPMDKAAELGCLAQVGPGGCGYEMQLEAGLKALWPSIDIDPMTGEVWVDPKTGQPGNRITFLTTQADQGGPQMYGYGDTVNGGFLRNSKADGQSLIAVILVTDEDDCSSKTVDHLRDKTDIYVADEVLAGPDVDPSIGQVPVNLRCVAPSLQKYLWESNRYVQGLQALRPDHKNLVIFGAIAGVPQYLVKPEVIDSINFEDENSRKQFYSQIRADQNMKYVLTSTGDNIRNACIPEGSTDGQGALPAWRILDVVEGFGENGVIQSICEDSFAGAINAIIKVISRELSAVCLPRELVRDANGEVGCKVVWELPAPDEGFSSAPMSCDDPTISAFVDSPEDPAEQFSGPHARCIVKQLAVVNKTKPVGEGWYYDDFSDEVKQQCRGDSKQRIAFGEFSQPENGVTVRLECLNEVQSLPQTRADLSAIYTPVHPAPTIGTKCEPDPAGVIKQDDMCKVQVMGGVDESLFCHLQLNVCVQRCNTDADCPKAWVCDTRDETINPNTGAGQPICVNPTCGSD